MLQEGAEGLPHLGELPAVKLFVMKTIAEPLLSSSFMPSETETNSTP